MSNSLLESEQTYCRILNFFNKNNRKEFIVKISNRSIDQWEIIYVNTIEEMMNIRSTLAMAETPFAGVTIFEGHYVMYFSDKNMFKCQNLDTGEILDFTDRTHHTFDLDRLLAEVKQFQGL